jgi:hypothetical protein
MGRVSKYRKLKSVDPYAKNCSWGKDKSDKKYNTLYNDKKAKSLSNREREFIKLVEQSKNGTLYRNKRSGEDTRVGKPIKQLDELDSNKSKPMPVNHAKRKAEDSESEDNESRGQSTSNKKQRLHETNFKPMNEWAKVDQKRIDEKSKKAEEIKANKFEEERKKQLTAINELNQKKAILRPKEFPVALPVKFGEIADKPPVFKEVPKKKIKFTMPSNASETAEPDMPALLAPIQKNDYALLAKQVREKYKEIRKEKNMKMVQTKKS